MGWFHLIKFLIDLCVYSVDRYPPARPGFPAEQDGSRQSGGEAEMADILPGEKVDMLHCTPLSHVEMRERR